MYLIVAIVLIVIIAIKVGNEKQRAHETDVLTVSLLQEEEKMKMLAKDRNLELLLNEKLRDPSKQKEVMEELSEVFAQIPSCERLNTFSYFPESKHQTEYSMALRILMAKRGKIPGRECWCNGSHSGTMFLPSQISAEDRQLRKCFKELMSWVESELQKHGLPVRLAVILSPPDFSPRFKEYALTGLEYYWDDYKKYLDCPNASTDSIRGFIWKLK